MSRCPIDYGEVTDEGLINQLAVLDRWSVLIDQRTPHTIKTDQRASVP